MNNNISISTVILGVFIAACVLTIVYSIWRGNDILEVNTGDLKPLQDSIAVIQANNDSLNKRAVMLEKRILESDRVIDSISEVSRRLDSLILAQKKHYSNRIKEIHGGTAHYQLSVLKEHLK